MKTYAEILDEIVEKCRGHVKATGRPLDDADIRWAAECSIPKLPFESGGRSVLQDWVMGLGLRKQGVLLTSVRGCDTSEREDHGKLLARCLRTTFLVPHCGDVRKSKSFFLSLSPPELHELMIRFTKSHDHMPHHYIMHIVHTAEIVGYQHPLDSTRNSWNWFYHEMCKKMHMKPESPMEMDARLDADEETFFKAQ